MAKRVELYGYAPDRDPTTSGVLTNCSAFIPSLRGMEGAPGVASTGMDALAAACRSSAVLRKLDDTSRWFAGSATKLYEQSSTSWTDRTRASGGDYGLGADLRWRFAQFGDVALAAAKSDILQYSAAGAFANLGASIPKAAIVETVGQFVFLFDVNDHGTLEDGLNYPDRWWCCAIGDHTNWTPAIATQCTTGRLTSAPGKIKAGRRFGEEIIAYKERAMYRGVYQGPPTAWAFQEIPGEIGALCQEVVVNVGTPEQPRHIFMGYENFYEFDGSRPVPIGFDVRDTVFGEINRPYAEQCLALHDRMRSRIYFFYPVSSSVNPDKCVVYNYRTKKWGRDDRTVEAVVEYLSAGVTYDSLGSSYATYADLPSVSYDSSFWTSRFPIPAIFNTSHVAQTLNGAAGNSSMTTGDMGDGEHQLMLSRVTPDFITAPTSGSMVNYYRQLNLGDDLTTGATVSMSSKRFDTLREAMWHRVRLDFTGDVELAAIRPSFSASDSDE
jgi:hypothetical protein